MFHFRHIYSVVFFESKPEIISEDGFSVIIYKYSMILYSGYIITKFILLTYTCI